MNKRSIYPINAWQSSVILTLSIALPYLSLMLMNQVATFKKMPWIGLTRENIYRCDPADCTFKVDLTLAYENKDMAPIMKNDINLYSVTGYPKIVIEHSEHLSFIHSYKGLFDYLISNSNKGKFLTEFQVPLQCIVPDNPSQRPGTIFIDNDDRVTSVTIKLIKNSVKKIKRVDWNDVNDADTLVSSLNDETIHWENGSCKGKVKIISKVAPTFEYKDYLYLSFDSKNWNTIPAGCWVNHLSHVMITSINSDKGEYLAIIYLENIRESKMKPIIHISKHS